MLTLAQAITNVETPLDKKDCFSTNVGQLDELFSTVSSSSSAGVSLGSTVEISGPPGSGKSLIALNLVADALKRGCRVLWISSKNSSIPLNTLSQISGFSASQLGCLRQVYIRSLLQLYVLLQSPTSHAKQDPSLASQLDVSSEPSALFNNPALVIVEDILPLLLRASQAKSPGLQESRRAFCIVKLMHAITRFTTHLNCATVLLCSCIPRFVHSSDPQPDSRHLASSSYRKMVPVTGYGSWEKWLSNRISLVRLSSSTVCAMDISGHRLCHIALESTGISLQQGSLIPTHLALNSSVSLENIPSLVTTDNPHLTPRSQSPTLSDQSLSSTTSSHLASTLSKVNREHEPEPEPEPEKDLTKIPVVGHASNTSRHTSPLPSLKTLNQHLVDLPPAKRRLSTQEPSTKKRKQNSPMHSAEAPTSPLSSSPSPSRPSSPHTPPLSSAYPVSSPKQPFHAPITTPPDSIPDSQPNSQPSWSSSSLSISD